MIMQVHAIIRSWHQEVHMGNIRARHHEEHMYKNRQNKSIGLRISIIVITLLILHVSILGCGGNESPVEAVKEYMSNMARNDYTHAYDLLARSNKEAKSYEEFTEKPSISRETIEMIGQFEYSLVEETPTEAKVRVTHPEEGDFIVLLVHEDGGWKIDFDASMDYEPPLESGTRITLEILGDYSESDIDGAMAIIEARLSSLEIYSRNVKQDDGSVVVEIPGDEDIAAVVETITQSGELQFREVMEVITEGDPGYEGAPLTIIDSDEIDAYLALRDKEVVLPFVSEQGEALKVRLGPTRLTGDIITTADAAVDDSRGGYKISFRLTDEATPQFAALTQELINKQLGIVLDYELESFPTVQSAIEAGEGDITGDFTREEARSVALLMKAGTCPIRFRKNPSIEDF
jgi:hypothetical protein